MQRLNTCFTREQITSIQEDGRIRLWLNLEHGNGRKLFSYFLHIIGIKGICYRIYKGVLVIYFIVYL